jgi:hypothetical protein
MNHATEFQQWQGTPADALAKAIQLLAEVAPDIPPPTLADLYDWQMQDLLSWQPAKRMTGRHVLEAAYVACQRSRAGLSIELAERMRQLSDHGLLMALRQPNQLRGTQAVILLAQGVLAQYAVAKSGRPVGVSSTIPLVLRQAQSQLARLALETGQPDTFASVQELLNRCRLPLARWAPAPIKDDARYASAVLIDEDYPVPSEECGLIAAGMDGGLANIIEQQLFNQLQQALQPLDELERDAVYTRIRRFIAEHPLATRTEWQQLRTDPRLTSLARFLEQVYEPAHATQARQHLVHRCARCHGPMRLNGLCSLVSCRERPYPPKEATPVPLAEALIARPEVLRYWCDPAQEELRLYHALAKVHGETQVHLYPHQDRCDVAIGPDIGFDVKDYRDPVRLARRLNTDLGGLKYYPHRVLVVATRRARNPDYIPLLREQLRVDLRHSLRVMSVRQAIITYKQPW